MNFSRGRYSLGDYQPFYNTIFSLLTTNSLLFLLLTKSNPLPLILLVSASELIILNAENLL